MRTNLKLKPELSRTSNPSTAPASPLSARRFSAGAEVLVRAIYGTGPSGRPEIVVSMDSAAIGRKIAVQEVGGVTISTTGKDTGFGTL